MAENNNYPDTVDSRSVEIIETIINQEEYDIPPQSRLEEVLLELKEAIEQGGGGGGNVYVTTTPLVDGATTNPIIVDGESVTVSTGDIAVYNHKEFIWNGSAWDELGDLSGLGEMAFLNRSDMGELAFEDLSDLDLGELAMKDVNDIHSTLSDTEYEALPDAKKNDGTEYFVYETSEDNRSIIAYDSNGNFLYKMSMYGCNDAGTLSLSSKITEPPTITGTDRWGTGSYVFKTTFADGNTYYHNDAFTSGSSMHTISNNSARVADAYGTNLFFAISGNRFTIMSAPDSAWVSSLHLDGYNESSFTYGAVETGNRKIYRNNEVYGKSENVGGFTRTVLYDSGSYSQAAPVSQDVNMLDNLSKYDIVSIITGTLPDNQSVPGTDSQSGYDCASAMFDVPYLLTSGCYAHIDGYNVRNMIVQFTDTTFNIKVNYGESSNQYLQIFKIIGYKWG